MLHPRLASPLFLLALLLAPLGAPSAAEPPRLLATIKPVHALAAAAMAGIATPELLIAGGGSPHTYNLRPSDAQAIGRADIVLWIGDGLEGFLRKPLENRPPGASLLTLAEAPGVELLSMRKGELWESHEHGHAGPERRSRVRRVERESGKDAYDAHLWLSPGNAAAMLRAIAAALADRDPGRAALYRANAQAALDDIARLDAEVKDMLAPVRGKPFVVFHDAYQYFERHYGLQAVAAITLSPEKQPGARRVQEIRRKLTESGAECVFSEPQFEPQLVQTVIEGTKVRTGVLDPYGIDLPPGPGAYGAMMRRLAQSLRACLTAQR